MRTVNMAAANRGREGPALHRPAAGVAVDPERLVRMRDWRAMTRIELSTRITDASRLAVGQLLDIDPEVLRPKSLGGGIPVSVLNRVLAETREGMSIRDMEELLPPDVLAKGLSRDSITKFDNGDRKPRPRTLRALCVALDCEPPYLMPDGPPFAAMPLAAGPTMARRMQSEYNKGLRDFADSRGYDYRDPDTGRIRYSRLPYDEYDRYLTGENAADQHTAALAS